MVIVLTGANDFSRLAELSRLTSEFIKSYGDFGLEKIEASNLEVGRLLESVSSLPFLAQRRMIVLTDVNSNKSLSENIDALLDSVADTTDLIINEPKFDKRLNLFKSLKKRCDLKEFPELDERSLPQWLYSEAKKRGGELSLADANYLIQRIGAGQLGASNELDKLLIYNPKITRQAIDLLTEKLPQSSVFDLLDAAFNGSTKQALELYEEQRRQQVEPQAIMGMIAWQVHILLVVKANEKLGAENIAAKAKLSPFVVSKTMNITNKMSLGQAKNLLKRVLDLDVRLKSESIDADDALKHLIISL